MTWTRGWIASFPEPWHGRLPLFPTTFSLLWNKGKDILARLDVVRSIEGACTYIMVGNEGNPIRDTPCCAIVTMLVLYHIFCGDRLALAQQNRTFLR